MRTSRDVLSEVCDQVAGYLPRLERLVAERPSPDGTPVRPGAPPHAPMPGNPQALFALMALHAAVRHAEDLLLYDRAGRATRGRGGSDGNTFDALKQIPKLAAGASDDAFVLANTGLEAGIRETQCVTGIEENRRWRHLPRQDGQALPPQCPYCEGYYLLADVDALLVVCSVPGCCDSNGDPPVASISVTTAGPELTWADGRKDRAPALGPAR